jgi:hypothetical protein
MIKVTVDVTVHSASFIGFSCKMRLEITATNLNFTLKKY